MPDIAHLRPSGARRRILDRIGPGDACAGTGSHGRAGSQPAQRHRIDPDDAVASRPGRHAGSNAGDAQRSRGLQPERARRDRRHREQARAVDQTTSACRSPPKPATRWSSASSPRRPISARSYPASPSRPSQFNTPVYTLRGVGFYETTLSASPTVAIYSDEVAYPFAAMTRGVAFDIERVEVLKGPQGTLFGQNTTGGAINYIASKPTDHFNCGRRCQLRTVRYRDRLGLRQRAAV